MGPTKQSPRCARGWTAHKVTQTVGATCGCARGARARQTLTAMSQDEVRELIGRREEWLRVKDVLQTQGSLKLDDSIVSLLEVGRPGRRLPACPRRPPAGPFCTPG